MALPHYQWSKPPQGTSKVCMLTLDAYNLCVASADSFIALCVILYQLTSQLACQCIWKCVLIKQVGCFFKHVFLILSSSFRSCLVFHAGRRTTVNFARAPAVSTNCVTLSRALLTRWTSGPSNAPSTTASPSGAGTTSGSPTPKWTVRLVSLQKSGQSNLFLAHSDVLYQLS